MDLIENISEEIALIDARITAILLQGNFVERHSFHQVSGDSSMKYKNNKNTNSLNQHFMVFSEGLVTFILKVNFEGDQ